MIGSTRHTCHEYERLDNLRVKDRFQKIYTHNCGSNRAVYTIFLVRDSDNIRKWTWKRGKIRPGFILRQLLASLWKQTCARIPCVIAMGCSESHMTSKSGAGTLISYAARMLGCSVRALIFERKEIDMLILYLRWFWNGFLLP